MKHYWTILKKYKTRLLISPFLVFIFVVSETILPMLMAQIVDDGVMSKNISVVMEIGLYMVVISFVGFGVNMLNIYLSSKVSTAFAADLRAKMFSKIQAFSFTEIDIFSTSSLITRLTSDVSRIQQVVLMSMRILLRSPLMLVMALFFVIRIAPGLSLIILASVPVLGVSIFFILQKAFPYFLKVQQRVDKLNAVVRENLINIRVVKSFVREKTETGKFAGSSEDLQDISIRAGNIMVTVFPVMQFVMNISVALILWFGGQDVIVGTLSVGSLISMVNYLMQILMSLMMLSLIFMNIARASASSKRILEVLKTESSLQNEEKGLENIYKLEKGEIEFRNVFFRYSGGENDVLKNISFKIKPRETIALVGATGSSKSTLLQLIPRLYDVGSGEILLDNVNVKDYNLDELHHKISMVLQNNELFTGTIEENLRWGKENATMDEIIRATKAAQAHDFIMSFTEGYQTMLGRGGVNVSGGQKQRICIARALLGKPRILLLDDSTSAVDTTTEQKIRAGLREMLQSTTVILVTQRISSMQSADKIIILDNGEINAIGTSEELLENSDIYKEIYNSQRLG